MGADIDCFRELIQAMQSLPENDIHFAGESRCIQNPMLAISVSSVKDPWLRGLD